MGSTSKLIPQLASDAMVLFYVAPQYEAIAKARRISFAVLVADRRTKHMP